MTYIGTFGDMDPDRRARSLQNAGQSIGSALQFALSASDRKKQEAKDERDREIQRFLAMAERYPDAAAAMGESLVTKYGEEMPHLRGIVESIKQGQEVKRGAQQAGERWISGVEGLERERQQLAGMESMPAIGTLGAALQTLGPAAAAQMRPEEFPRQAADELPFRDRMAARVWAQQQGFEFPEPQTPFDPYSHLTQAQKSLHAQRTGAWQVPGAGDAAEIAAGMKPSAGAELSAEVRREEGERAKKRIEIQEQQQSIAERRLALDQAKEARIASGKTEGGNGAKPKSVVPEVGKWLAGDTALLAEEWDAGLKASADAANSKATPEERETYEKVAGRRPAPLLKAQASLIASRIASDLGPNATPEMVQLYADAARGKYLCLVGSGLDRDVAVRHVLNSTVPKGSVCK